MAAANGIGNGADHAPLNNDTLFERESKDMGMVEELGHVVIREAPLAEVWPYLGNAGEDVSSFGLRVLAASIEVNGHRITFEQLQNTGMRKMRVIQSLLREVQQINGMLEPVVEPGGEEKNVDAAASVPPDGSPGVTAS